MTKEQLAKDQLRIVELTIENVKRLSAVHIVPKGSTIVIGGKNAQGKTSVLDAIEMALAGTKFPKPVHGDEGKGRIVADLGEIVVTRTFTAAGGSSLTVASRDGAKFGSPQTMLDAMLGRISFDPLVFTRMKPADQLTTLRDLAGVSTALIDASRAAAYDERTAFNRSVKELDAHLAKMPKHDDAPTEPLSVSEITAKLKEASGNNAQREKYIMRAKEEELSVGALDLEIKSLAARIGQMKTDSEARHKTLEGMRSKAAEWAEVDEQAITDSIDGLEDQNRKYRENKSRADAEAVLSNYAAKAAELTAEIDSLDARRLEKLRSAKYPVPGLMLAEAGILYNDLPFEQASSAEQLRVSVGIGLAMNPKIRVLLVRDGSLLDEDSLAILQGMAEEAGSQVWLERVSKGDECSVIIEDGRVAK